MLGRQDTRHPAQRRDAEQDPPDAGGMDDESNQGHGAHYMTPACRQAVSAAAGRALTDAEVRKIDDRLSATMRNIARRDTARWQGLPRDARVLEAAQQAMADLQQEAALKVTRASLQIIKTAATEERL